MLFFAFKANAQDLEFEEAVNGPNAGSYPVYSEVELRRMVASTHNAVVQPKFDGIVKSYLETYTVKKRQKTASMLGRAQQYFPLIRSYLQQEGMPDDLKYLPVLESALNPRAISRSGAAGLWQFMPATGQEYGLSINSLVDERMDPNKSTLSAIKYLRRLYGKYQNWELALAAYNGGPGRVNRAIKRGRSKNFWRIRRYLPVETRNYVPAFIAASYIIQSYHHHNLSPLVTFPELQETSTTKVYDRISFYTISEVTGTPLHIIEELNPSYKRRFVPSSVRGNYLILPTFRLINLLRYLDRPDESNRLIKSKQIFSPENIMLNELFYRTSYAVKPGDKLNKIANKYNCSPKDIMKWNNLNSTKIYVGQYLSLFQPKKSAVDYLPTPIRPYPFRALPQTQESKQGADSPKPTQANEIQERKTPQQQLGMKFHHLKRGETLMEVAAQYPDLSLEELLRMNNISPEDKVLPGRRLLVSFPD